jgi:hypothetical protein
MPPGTVTHVDWHNVYRDRPGSGNGLVPLGPHNGRDFAALWFIDHRPDVIVGRASCRAVRPTLVRQLRAKIGKAPSED